MRPAAHAREPQGEGLVEAHRMISEGLRLATEGRLRISEWLSAPAEATEPPLGAQDLVTNGSPQGSPIAEATERAERPPVHVTEGGRSYIKPAELAQSQAWADALAKAPKVERAEQGEARRVPMCHDCDEPSKCRSMGCGWAAVVKHYGWSLEQLARRAPAAPAEGELREALRQIVRATIRACEAAEGYQPGDLTMWDVPQRQLVEDGVRALAAGAQQGERPKAPPPPPPPPNESVTRGGEVEYVDSVPIPEELWDRAREMRRQGER